MRCHNGNCPPCLEVVTRLCKCGKELKTGVFCHKSTDLSCGAKCNEKMPCAHKCTKYCHIPGKCYVSEEHLMENGCGQKCLQERKECVHRCQAICHPDKDCPKVLCKAEIRLYCKCETRHIQAICNSDSDTKMIDCDKRCEKKARDERIAKAFSNKEDIYENKAGIKFEYYPEE